MSLFELCRPDAFPPLGSGGRFILLNNNRINKGMALSVKERQFFGMEGLMPQGIMSQEQQARRAIEQLRAQPDDMARFIHLDALRERNEKLFFKVLQENLDELLPVVYTPNVGSACINFEFKYPKALFIDIVSHKSVKAINRVLGNWKDQDVRAIVVTDGERILGLGDLGVGGIEIAVSKLTLYVALGRVQPQWCLPVLLDVGTDNANLLNDCNYMGLRQPRLRGERYDQFVDNFMEACRRKFGPHILIQFEDFGKSNAARLLRRYQNNYCTFNDDIQGTGSVTIAGLLAAAKITKQKISESKFLFHGAGMAAIGISELLVSQMQFEGLSRQNACERIFLFKSDGLVTKSRQNLMDEQKAFAKEMAEMKELADVVKAVQPSAIIGVSTASGAFTDAIIKEMAAFNDRPVIFALSNPTSKSECTAEAAYFGTNGRALFASGSPFPPVKISDERTLMPGHCNNSYIFPGVALGVILFKIAPKLAESVTDAEISSGALYPSLSKIPEVSIQIAVAIAEECFKDGTAQLCPEPSEKELFVRSQLYNTDYEDILPKMHSTTPKAQRKFDEFEFDPKVEIEV
uniref:Malic enzyme n=1 Tax=Globodera rostochiensis TaxID=31243 RepID=A0A914H4B1_GLORO